MKRCSKKYFCKQCRYVTFTGTMTKWPVQKPTHRMKQKHIEHHDATYIKKKTTTFVCVLHKHALFEIDKSSNVLINAQKTGGIIFKL